MKDCLELKLKWEECSIKLVTREMITNKEYQDRMNICFLFYKRYKDCLTK